jgi:hypothetical protein
MVLDRLISVAPARITLDFDGSVQSTKRRAEGTAVGFNRKKKGARSYYPLFCTIAQTLQVLDFLHRSGNVHDSKGAKTFILACIDAVRVAVPGAQIEVRMDSAFFSDDIVTALVDRGVQFTISVPFERFVELKGMIEQRRRWRRVDGEVSYFEDSWKPQCWDRRFRFLFIRTRVKKQKKGPIQLDLSFRTFLDRFLSVFFWLDRSRWSLCLHSGDGAGVVVCRHTRWRWEIRRHAKRGR